MLGARSQPSVHHRALGALSSRASKYIFRVGPRNGGREGDLGAPSRVSYRERRNPMQLARHPPSRWVRTFAMRLGGHERCSGFWRNCSACWRFWCFTRDFQRTARLGRVISILELLIVRDPEAVEFRVHGCTPFRPALVPFPSRGRLDHGRILFHDR